MSNSRRRSSFANMGGFLTAHIVGEPYGEMQPRFMAEIFEQLEENLVLIDRQNRRMNVQFNGSLEHPLIVEGWTEMREFFGINGNKMLLFTYIGRNRFVVDVQPQQFQPQALPTYHSYKYFFDDPVSFNVTLTEYMATKSQLTLRSDFANYVRRTGYTYVILYGPTGDEVGSIVLKRKRGRTWTVKFGTEWKDFVDLNQFQPGDTLNFKFVNKAESNIMKVIQID